MYTRLLEYLVIIAGIATVALAVPTANDCNRSCLLNILTAYTDGLQARNTSGIPAAATVKATSNGEAVALGKGLAWNIEGTIRFPYRKAFVDAASGSAIMQMTVTNYSSSSLTGQTLNATLNNTISYYMSLRLKVAYLEITEIEENVGNGFPGSNVLALTTPDRIWDTIIPEAEQSTTEELQALVTNYWQAAEGKFNWRSNLFHPECFRYEDATQTVEGSFGTGGCGTEYLNPAAHWNITNRRFYVTDPVRGTVVAYAEWNPPSPSTVICEAWKIYDGLIAYVEALYPIPGPVNGSGWT